MLSLLAVVFLEGVSVATRISTDNAQLLAADGVAWDAVWKKFNESYDKIAKDTNQSFSETLAEAAAPSLYAEGCEATLTLRITNVPDFPNLRCISADVEWGPRERRRKLSSYHDVWVYRSNLGRVKSWK